MKKHIFIITLFVFYNFHAQSGFETIFLADKNDSKKIISSYFAPRIEGYLSGLNNGWFYSAKSHKPFGFDFSVNLVNVIYTNDDEVFNTENLSSLNLPSGSLIGTTSLGEKTTTPFSVTKTVNGNNVTANGIFNGGTDGSFFNKTSSIPIAQIGVGISNGFDLMLRLTPEIKLNNGNESLSVLGFGCKKEVTNWFPKSTKLPLHLSIIAGYTLMTANYGIENKSFPSGNESGIQVQNAISEFSLRSFTLQTIGSLEWNTFSFFGSIGYYNGNSNFRTTGNFKAKYKGAINPEIEDLDIPQDIKFNVSNFSATIGSRINLRYFKIFGSFSIQEFKTTSLGIAFSIK
ncbi:DUF6588 family protein [Polaribacter aquimarinus]|uniref:Uncharacterized protein n=1 Tax=Polaribacter aquimarinus TaxID=2100726 RepID=A0A2U2JEA9_9FLAO|nr:DUF6588 family protein [Polaribacter aquimarinus]PWG06601.1 hypothetical protein DIS07_01835 [Polaribacter aquimarinus]